MSLHITKNLIFNNAQTSSLPPFINAENASDEWVDHCLQSLKTAIENVKQTIQYVHAAHNSQSEVDSEELKRIISSVSIRSAEQLFENNPHVVFQKACWSISILHSFTFSLSMWLPEATTIMLIG